MLNVKFCSCLCMCMCLCIPLSISVLQLSIIVCELFIVLFVCAHIPLPSIPIKVEKLKHKEAVLNLRAKIEDMEVYDSNFSIDMYFLLCCLYIVHRVLCQLNLKHKRDEAEREVCVENKKIKI
jgi:hypothetical protein